MSTQPVPSTGKEEFLLSRGDRREILVAEHHVLRRQLEELRENAGRLLAGKDNATIELIRTLSTLQSLLRDHLDHEEALLEPVLEKIDPWGPVRLERLHQEHAHQRAWLSTLHNALSTAASVEDLALQSFTLCDALFIDMVHEERDLFSALRDEMVHLDVGEN